jgi:anti-sigma factor RsiW
MTHHLSELEIKQLCVSALPEDELAAAAVHTAECQACDQRFIKELKRQRGRVPFNFTLEPEFWFRNEHLDFDDLVGLADNTFDEETREIINIHLSTCDSCREHVRDFLAFREDTAGEMNVSYGATHYEPNDEIRATPWWWQRLPRRPVYAVAAIVLVAVAVLIGVIALSRRSGPLEANKQEQINRDSERSPSISPRPAPNVEDSAKVAALKDAGGEVTIDRDGRITGLDEVSENSRQYVARAALSEQIAPSEVLRRLSGEPARLRGNNDGPQDFRLLYPVRRVVTEARPIFRWESLPGVSSYRVYVLNQDGRQISQSEELPPTQTQWEVPASLRRGQFFSWVVTALVDGKKVVSPSASVAEIKFAVLSTADLQELNRLKKSNSHLALGVFYARVGLLNESEREFEHLVELNPQSELPRKLLQSVRTIRKAA